MKDAILWVYIVLLVVGGLIGYFKAKSKVSLMTSVVSAGLLVLCATNVLFKPSVANLLANVLLAILLVLFAWRLTKGKKFMPSGLMVVLTLGTLVLRNIF